MIGIFDSGIGGLTVVKAIRQRLSAYDIIYFGDTARGPYGNKSFAAILDNLRNGLEILRKCGAGIIVVACHAAAAAVYDPIGPRFDLPVLEVVSPAAKLALRQTTCGRLGIIVTRATIAGGLYAKKIGELDASARVYSLACPLLIPLAEEGWLNHPITCMIVKKYVHALKVRQIDTLILGCSYFPLFRRIIQTKIGRRVHLIDPSLAVADSLAQFLDENAAVNGRLTRNQSLRLMVSDFTDQIELAARMILKQKVRLEQCSG